MKKVLITALAAASLAPAIALADFEHPGVMFNAQDLERMKNNISVDPWKTGYEIMLSDSRSDLDYDMQGPFETVTRNGDNDDEFEDDGYAVLYQSILYYITGDEEYAENAREIILAWASTHKYLDGNVPHILAELAGSYMIIGAEILRAYYPGWTSDDTDTMVDYVTEVYWPLYYVPDPLKAANQGAGQLSGAIAVAIFTDDQDAFDEVIESFINDPCAGISNTLASGETGDTGRDYGHAFGMILNLAKTAQMAHKQNVDLFSVLDNRLHTITEYWNAYGLYEDVDYTPYGTCYDFYETIGSSGQGSSDSNTNILLEIIEGAYATRLGIETPYTTERIEEIDASVNTFLYKVDSDYSTSESAYEPYDEHTGTTDNELTSVSIGDDISDGSSSYDASSDVWTLVGSGDVYGYNDEDSFQFSYMQMDTNATLIAKVEGIDSTNDNAKVGIMFRETLASDSDMYAVYAHYDDGVESTWRGQTVVNEEVSTDGFQNSSYEDVTIPGWIKIVVNGNRVTGYYSEDAETWSPVQSTIFDSTSDYYLGLFSASNEDSATGTFSSVAVYTDDSSSFEPDPDETYYLDVPKHNLRLAATGESEDPYTTSTDTTGEDVEWQFVDKGNGYWHIQRAAGGTMPRLRTDGSLYADMQDTSYSGSYTYYQFTEGSSDNTHFITLPDGPENYQRLQMTDDGEIRFFPTTADGSWESWEITEVDSESVVHMIKRNSDDYAIDGNYGGANEQDIYLWSQDEDNVNQQWIEIDRGDGYYSYQKMDTDYCIDGDNGGENAQNVYLWECDEDNQNQHWLKVDRGDGYYSLIKRNASDYALDGNNGGEDGQSIYLWSVEENNQNQHWLINEL
jgi:regulation of enolase protein 1 (concanavalin A-like superfamily)